MSVDHVGGNVGPEYNAFDVDGLRELQREARRLTAGLTPAVAPAARYDGWDRSRSVHIVVDGSGRLVDVQVGRSWRDALEPAGLGTAVLDAVNAAEADRMDAFAQAVPPSADDPAAGADNLDEWAPAASRAGDTGRFPAPGDPDVLASTRDLFYLAMDAIDRLSEAGRALDETKPDPTVRAHSPDRQVTVTVESGRVVAVDFEEDWLKQAAAVEITRRLGAAFEAAERAGPQAAAAKALDHPSIRELQQVSADPQELLRRLGLG